MQIRNIISVLHPDVVREAKTLHAFMRQHHLKRDFVDLVKANPNVPYHELLDAEHSTYFINKAGTTHD